MTQRLVYECCGMPFETAAEHRDWHVDRALFRLKRRVAQEAAQVCQCCGAPLRIYAVFADRPDRLSAECKTPGCPLEMVTLAPDALATLTPAQIDGWARLNAGQRERRALGERS